MASRVVPGWALTTSRRSPNTALINEDLPTLGRPTTASPTTSPSPSAGAPSGGAGRAATRSSRKSFMP